MRRDLSERYKGDGRIQEAEQKTIHKYSFKCLCGSLSTQKETRKSFNIVLCSSLRFQRTPSPTVHGKFLAQ